MNFNCNGCGACCRRVGTMPKELLVMNKLEVNPDGSCKNFQSDNSCSIYETRPSICRVSDMQKDSGLSQLEYFQLTASVCNIWMDEDKSDYPRLDDDYADHIIDSDSDD